MEVNKLTGQISLVSETTNLGTLDHSDSGCTEAFLVI